MAYNKTIFRQMLNIISRLDFEKIVNKHNGNYRVRTLTCWNQYVHLLFGQFGSRHSLRDIIHSSNSQINKLYHLGSKTVKRSTLADANNKRPYEIYQELFYTFLKRVQNMAPKYKLKLSSSLYMLDTTTIDLCLKLFPWARFRSTKAGINIHTLMQADGSLPVFLNITDGKVKDITAARLMDFPEGSYLTFDRGYHDFDLYKHFKDKKIRFVTRLKKNARYRTLSFNEPDPETGILSDSIIEFTGYKSHKKYPFPLRLIVYRDAETDKELFFLTNDFELDAKTLADIYKARWEIELFFKMIKQNLKIKRFIATSKNAVLTQIWIAMIAYLMVSYLKFSQKIKFSIQQIFRLLEVNLMERKFVLDLIKPKSPHTMIEQFCLF